MLFAIIIYLDTAANKHTSLLDCRFGVSFLIGTVLGDVSCILVAVKALEFLLVIFVFVESGILVLGAAVSSLVPCLPQLRQSPLNFVYTARANSLSFDSPLNFLQRRESSA